jgi:hypothetical protein
MARDQSLTRNTNGYTMRSLRPWQSHIASVLLLLYLPGCTSTHVVAVPHPEQFVESARPPVIRGTTTNGMTFTLASPVIRGDSLVGTVGSQEASHTIGFRLSEFRNLSIDRPYAISWQAGMPTPARYVEAKRPQSIRVTLTGGATLKLKSPAVRGDSLVGSVSSEGAAPSTGVALTDVTSVAVSKIAAGRTVLLIVGLVAVPLVAIVAISGLSSDCHTSDCW